MFLVMLALLASPGLVLPLPTASTQPSTQAPRAEASSQDSSAGGGEWALIIGIDRFQGPTRTNFGGVGDAMDVQEALLRHGWRQERIKLLTDGSATAEGMRAGMQWLVDNSSDDSFSLFFYSGHTKQLGGDGDRDGEALDEYLWPHDNRFISDGEFAGYMRSLKGRAWIGIAGCEAAGFDDGVSSPRRMFAAASQENEKGYEYPPWKNSVWGGLFFDQGVLQGQADANGDGRVSLNEANSFAAERAPEMTRGQAPGPQHPYLAGGDGTHWFLTPPPPPPAPPPPPGEQPAPECPLGLCVEVPPVPRLQ